MRTERRSVTLLYAPAIPHSSGSDNGTERAEDRRMQRVTAMNTPATDIEVHNKAAIQAAFDDFWRRVKPRVV